jgi:hypothetical protein
LTTEEERVYNPLSRESYEAIAYNAIGRASEVNNLTAYGLSHSTGNSGWSVGFMQWDFGQPSRGERADDMLARYQQWAPENQRYSDNEIASLSTRLTTRGQVGNDLTTDEKLRLNGFLRSDEGRQFVGELDRQQTERKWNNVGQPLSQIEWLRTLNETEPQQVAEIVAMTSKLYNQNERRGGLLIEHLQQNNLTSDQTRDWIGAEGIDGLNQNAREAIVSGRDKALTGVRLMNALEVGDGQISRMWQEEMYQNQNLGLNQNFNTSASVQLLDKMMRDPLNGERIRAQIDEDAPRRQVVMAGGATETARVELNNQGVLSTRSPSGIESSLTPNGWVRNDLQITPEAQPLQQREVDRQDHSDRGRAPIIPRQAPRNSPEEVMGNGENPLLDQVPRPQRPIQHNQADQNILPVTAPTASDDKRDDKQVVGVTTGLQLGNDFREKGHPGNAAYENMLHEVKRMETTNGIAHGPNSELVAAALLVKAEQSKFRTAEIVRMEPDGMVSTLKLSLNEPIPKLSVDPKEVVAQGQSFEKSTQLWAQARSPHYASDAPAAERTLDQVKALAQMTPMDQTLFEKIRQNVPSHISDDVVAKAMLQTKEDGILTADKIGTVDMAGDSIMVRGQTAVKRSVTDVSEPAAPMADTAKQTESFNQQLAIDQRLAQEQALAKKQEQENQGAIQKMGGGAAMG